MQPRALLALAASGVVLAAGLIVLSSDPNSPFSVRTPTQPRERRISNRDQSQVAEPAASQPEAVAERHEWLLNPDGTWKFSNRLMDATSPYLLQHAHNPVEWYPWGAEALAAAKEQNKPIFLSVGYSTCYWCHVMEREVFTNLEIAALMNKHFINIKVDREQRPDLDEVYMMATRLMTRGRGGWPNSVFLTPDLKPFFAGTYFGATAQGGRPGFPTIVTGLADAWANRRPQVLVAADNAAAAIQRALNVEGASASAPLTMSLVDSAVSDMSRRYDRRLGGFGVAPRFPQGYTYPFLIDAAQRTGNEATLNMALHTLRMMAAGGMYDHVGGGFHRYSTDAQWRVPHFEKMLYNQAQLTRAYVRAFQVTGETAFGDTARDILRYVDDVMMGPDGQFYSALDAETDGVEGAYYAWNKSAIRDTLDAEQRALFNDVFAQGQIPTYPGHLHPDGRVIYMRKPLSELAPKRGEDYVSRRTRVDAFLAELKSVRDQRKLPRLDDKVIAGWNGLMIDAYAFAGTVLDEPEYIAAAERAAGFILENMRMEDGRLWRIWRSGVAEQPAFQEDYAYVIRGLLSLHTATGERRWLDAAGELARTNHQLFWDEGSGGYYFAQEAPDLIARSKSVSEGAIPSGNAVMVHNLIDLWLATGEAAWRSRAKQTLDAFSGSITRSPSAFLHMVHALQRYIETEEENVPEPDPKPFDLSLPDLSEEFGVLQPLDGGQHVEISVVVQPTRVRAGSNFEVRVVLQIEQGWHVNVNPAPSPYLIPTVVDIRGSDLVELLSVAYPSGRLLKASYAEEPIKVLDGREEIIINTKLAESARSGTTATFTVLVQFQACDDARCLAPTEKLIEVSIRVAE